MAIKFPTHCIECKLPQSQCRCHCTRKKDNSLWGKHLDNIEHLFEGDERLDALYRALHAEIADRTYKQNMPIVTVLGILDLIHSDLVEQTKE